MANALDRAWRRLAWRVAVLVLIALAIGWWLHALTATALIVALAVIAAGTVRLAQLTRLLDSAQWLPASEKRGLFDEIQNLLRRRQRHRFGTRRRLVHLLRAFRDAASALPDAVVALDHEQRIEWFNAAATRLLGLKYPQDLGGHLTSLVRAPRFAGWLRTDASEPLTDLAAPFDERIRLNLRLIRYADGRSLLVARDVSQLMRLEQVRRDFVANVSHELRTPLTVVHGYLDMIEPEQIPEYEPIMHELRRQSRRMTQIVEDLLTLSRLEAHGAIVEERISMRAMLETLRREAAALSHGAHEITAHAAADADLIGSRMDLHSAFSNLVSNAVRYTPDGGKIAVRWALDGDGARLSVIDTGQGIAPQHLPRLTERFYRVSTSRSRDTGGTGLGLSIVKHILQLHQARLDIESEAGVGSTFACVFGNARVVAPERLAALS